MTPHISYDYLETWQYLYYVYSIYTIQLRYISLTVFTFIKNWSCDLRNLPRVPQKPIVYVISLTLLCFEWAFLIQYVGFQNAHSVWVRSVTRHHRLKNRTVSFCPVYHFAPVSPIDVPTISWQNKVIKVCPKYSLSFYQNWQVYTYSIPGVFAQGAKHPLFDYLSFL